MFQSQHRQIILWLFSGCFLVAAMVMVGGITRLTGSGLSIVEWNVIMGAVPPLDETDWNEIFGKYKATPQFQKVNYDFSLEDFKSIFWWEYIHRLLGRVIGLVFIIPFIYFLVKKKLSPPLIRKLLVLLLLGGFQGFLGWFMVYSGLIDNPRVSHYRLAAHLLTAFAAYAYSLWLALELIYFPSATNHNKQKTTNSFNRLLYLITFLVVIQVIYGAFVAGLRAGLVYNTFPKMGDEWMASAVTAITPWWKNIFENMAGVQFIHRCIAWLLAVSVIALWVIAKKQKATGIIRNSINLLLVVIVVQFILGVFTLLFRVPLSLALLHQLGALAVLTLIVYLNYIVRLTRS